MNTLQHIDEQEKHTILQSINDLHSLKNNPNNQINVDTVHQQYSFRKLCGRYFAEY